MKTAISSLMVAAFLVASTAHAEPLDLLLPWEGSIDYFITGAPLAVDGPDGDTTDVDTLSQPASVDVTSTDVPSAATVVAAYLYWGGTVQDQSDCATAPLHMDDEVILTVPGGTPTALTADECFCEIGAGSYDIQACRAAITSRLTSGLLGTYTVDEFDAYVRNGSTDNASFALVLVYDEPASLPPRRIALYDGLEELYEGTRIMNLTGLDADTPAHGDIAWYVLDGDVGGVGPESVQLQGVPGGATTTVFDSVNPADNPMNRTINTVSPPLTGVLGVDIDKLDASSGLTPGDTSVTMTYTAGGDKYWVVFNIVGINVYRAHIPIRLSSKSWDLNDDADHSLTITPGDTIRFTIHLVNVGTAPGYVDITDDIPAGFESLRVIADAGGTDRSTATRLIIDDIYIAASGTADVIFDVVVSEGTLGESIINAASFDAGPDGNSGTLVAPPVVVGDVAPDELPEDVTEPVTEPSPEPEPDIVDEPLTDVTIDEVEDVAADPHTPGDRSTGCGCSIPGSPSASPLLLLLLLLLLRRRS